MQSIFKLIRGNVFFPLIKYQHWRRVIKQELLTNTTDGTCDMTDHKYDHMCVWENLKVDLLSSIPLMLSCVLKPYYWNMKRAETATLGLLKIYIHVHTLLYNLFVYENPVSIK